MNEYQKEDQIYKHPWDYNKIDEDIKKNWTKPKPCNSPSHNPPGMIVIPHGKRHIHTCPACGEKFIMNGPTHTL